MSKGTCKTPQKSKGGGAYGTYYLLDKNKKIGVKTVGCSTDRTDWIDEFDESLEYFFKVGRFGFDSLLLESAEELAALIMLQNVDGIPRGYELVWVDRHPYYAIGICMEHVDGQTFCDKWKDVSYLKMSAFKRKITPKIRRAGIILGDWHDENVMVDKQGKEYRIDFSRDCFKVYPEFRKRFNALVKDIILEAIVKFPK